ncbi:probable serine/threonine-protein kinase pats1 [Saccostrea cucullata]|uniref:probable serine/threonine-protein kinase pats1 n=1 Tax=Saccostrea cuccullata TaxID=36930 RepID=UPI002ED2E791
MYAFVTECLREDSDLKFFLTTASRDVISEYCRSWEYKRSEGERCLYVPNRPEKMYDLLIDKLQLDIISHCTMSERRIHNRISQRLGVPIEVLKWDQEARERYVEYAKRGTQTVHHARGMIVGCAGAGKTTLLKRLLGCSEEEIKEVKSTEGLEVHEEIFDICDETRSLKARQINKDDKEENNSATNIGAKTLTFFDFGGQCAYYACHQIYLTRRAFYVVVVDASKRLDQKLDKEVCDQDGSVFSGWTYGDYFEFWMKSIHTYCSYENDKELKPVALIVATHWEENNRQYKDKHTLLDSLNQQIPKHSKLSQYIVENNCYCIQFPAEALHSLSKHMFNIANHQRWKETIPKEWAFLEIEIKLRKHSERIIKIENLTMKVTDSIKQEDPEEKLTTKSDMLRYYHDAGKVLYFNEEGLKEFIIIDVQWFIDAFKHIITDKLHFKGIPVASEDWEEFYSTGNLEDHLLTEIWRNDDNPLSEKLPEDDEWILSKTRDSDPRYLLYHKKQLLNFMQRLGLMAVGNKSHYVPCMNRKEIENAIPDLIQRGRVNICSYLQIQLLAIFPLLPPRCVLHAVKGLESVEN